MEKPIPITHNWINVTDFKLVEQPVIALKKKEKVSSILDLPVEITLHIFSYLQPTCLLKRVALVCKTWNDLVQDHSLWKCLSLNFNKLASCDLLNLFLKFPHLQKLSIEQGTFGKDFTLSELSNIQQLSLTFCEISEDFANSFEMFFNENAASLKYLNLEGSNVCAEILNKIYILRFLIHLNLSHCVNLNGSSLTKILENCSQLELLDLDGINSLGDYDINSIFRLRSDSLIHITVDGDHLTDKAFKNLHECCKLNSLNIAFCENLTDSILHKIMYFKHLKTLKLRKGYLFSSSGLNTLFTDGQLFNLTHLNVAECSLLDNSNLLAIANCCQRLISLNLSWCWEITDESLCYFVKKCPFIKILNLTGLVRIQGDFTIDLKEGLLQDLRVVDLEQCGCVKDKLLLELFKMRPNLKIFGFWGDLVPDGSPSDGCEDGE